MTTTTPVETDIDILYPDLSALVFGIAVQQLDPTAVPAGLESLLPTAGRATLRNRSGEPTTHKQAEKANVETDALKGAEKYARPNGHDYYSR